MQKRRLDQFPEFSLHTKQHFHIQDSVIFYIGRVKFVAFNHTETINNLRQATNNKATLSLETFLLFDVFNIMFAVCGKVKYVSIRKN